jgi:hypothetical protein
LIFGHKLTKQFWLYKLKEYKFETATKSGSIIESAVIQVAAKSVAKLGKKLPRRPKLH